MKFTKKKNGKKKGFTKKNTIKHIGIENNYEKLNLKHDDVQQSLIKLFKTPFAPSNVTPKTDFYTYINHKWMQSQTNEAKTKYYVQLDSFRMVQEKVYYELIEIVKDYIKNNDTELSRSMKNLYYCMLNLDDHETKKQIIITKNAIDHAINTDSLYWLLAQINQNEVLSWGCPISWMVDKDQKNSKYYKSSISEPQLTLYDYELYIENSNDDAATKTYKKQVKAKYLEYVDEMFDACLGKNHGLKALDVWNVEYDMLSMMGCSKIKRDDENGYNVLTHDESLNKYNFDWFKFASELGYDSPPKTFICSSLNYLKCAMEVIHKEWKTAKWKTYFLYIVFRQIIRFHKEWRLIHWNFHGKFIQGQSVPWPDEIYPVFGLSLCFNSLLTNEYVKKNKNEDNIDFTTALANDLLIVFKRMMKRNTWLSPKTKKYALLKLEHIKLVIGSPEYMRNDPVLNYNDKGAYNNIKKIAWWRTKKMISVDGTNYEGDIPTFDWEQFKMVGSQAYMVNAYYIPVENTIYIPLAYLQKPFIDLENRGLEYNLAHIGYTLAHEMSHSLDDFGSNYDHKGNLHNWWTKEDKKQFKKKMNDVIKQYETFALYDGIVMDGMISVGENIADIVGLTICMEYLRDFQEVTKEIVPIRSASFQTFFVYVAYQARQYILNKAIKAQLKVNPHPMDKYRVNCPLARMELFRNIYNIKKGDKMYWSSTNFW